MNTPTEPRRRLDNTEHLVPHANRMLAGAARATLKGMWFLVRVAVRIPGWFLRVNRRHVERKR